MSAMLVTLALPAITITDIRDTDVVSAAGTGERNQNDTILHVGLGDHAGPVDHVDPVDLEVLWLDGTQQSLQDVSVYQAVTISYSGSLIPW